MRPWQHSRSSASQERDWRADLPIHEFMDSTKAACPDLRHRMILHNADLGPELVARAFPDRLDAQAVALRHVYEDLGCTPTLANWLDQCDHEKLPRPLSRRLPLDRDCLARQLSQGQRLRDQDEMRVVLDVLLLPIEIAGPIAYPILLNGFGPTVARTIFGPPREVPGLHGSRAVFDAAYAAEGVAYWVFGTILPLVDVVHAVAHAPGPRGSR